MFGDKGVRRGEWANGGEGWGLKSNLDKQYTARDTSL